ncbi:phage holin family protein [Sulfurospirillum cavolei]|uniref:phage holin family protein n=1 Tax=Sulfurospirillum cavolei TaxID=366522 RepID=UPI0005A95E31|nr:phage holin family protein [Sulfurospirillum cavolei]
MNNEKLTFWAWFVFVAFIGAILGYFTKNKEPVSKVERLKGLAIGVTTSMFAAYVMFQIAFFYFQNENVSVAIAGVAAWMGADAFLTLEKIITNTPKK